MFVGIITSSISLGTPGRGNTKLVPDSIAHASLTTQRVDCLRRSVIFSDLAYTSIDPAWMLSSVYNNQENIRN